MSRRLTIFLVEFVFLLGSLSCQSTAQISKSGQSLAIAKLHFPQPWSEGTEPGSTLSLLQQIEVRKVPNSSTDEFFLAALPNGDNDNLHEIDTNSPKPIYSDNSFAVNFTPGLQVRAATSQEWEAASRIVTKSRMIASNGRDDSSGEIKYRSKKFQKVGKYWGSVGSPQLASGWPSSAIPARSRRRVSFTSLVAVTRRRATSSGRSTTR